MTLMFSFSAIAKKKIIYKYKKFESFDMDDLNVEGVAGTPGEITINPRFRKKYKNLLPNKYNFNKEMKRSIEAVL
jgi:hypothetical protein